MFAKRASPPSRTATSPQSPSPGPNAMKACSCSSSLPSVFGGPAAAVLIALAGAALVAIGLILVGVREVGVGQWAPPLPPISQTG